MDAAGKIFGLPVYLLRSKYCDKIRLYCDCHAGGAYAGKAARVTGMGFLALKFDLDLPVDNKNDPYNGRLTNAAIREKREIVAAVREAIGYDIDLAFDCYWDYSVESTKRLPHEVEEFDLMWLEDLIPPENMDVQKEVTKATRTPVATGENWFRVLELSDLIYNHGVDIVTPDPATVGGLTETMRIADCAEENYIPISLHNVCSSVGTMACVHLGVATPNFDLLEYHALEVDWWDDLLARDEPLIENGRITVLESLRLGIEVDMDVVKEHLLDGTAGF